MAEISASLVKSLREKTGAGMMDCKKALLENNGVLEEAIDWLRKNGLSMAAKKAGRVASEGLVGVASRDLCASIIEVNTETDFSARNVQFQNFVKDVSILALDHETLESLLVANHPSQSSVQDHLTSLIATIGENMNIRRVQTLKVKKGIVATYIHNAVSPQMGKIGVLIALESDGDIKALLEIGKKLAMHVAAANPQALTITDLDPSLLEREKAILVDQAKASGRPDDVIEKMVEGRIRKFYEEVVLIEQAFVMDSKTKIADFIAQSAKEIGSPIALKGFVRFGLGEGIEKEVVDFAAEVKAQL
jgi:elongation factor Ts